MLNKIQSLLYQQLNRRKDYPDDELHNYVLMLAIALIAGMVHITFTVFFFIVGSPLLGTSHFLGVFVFVLAYRLLEQRRYDTAGVIVSVMILLSSFATIFTIGGDNFSILYQFLVLLMQMVVPFTKKKIPTVLTILLPFIMVASYLFDLVHTPLQSIGIANNVLTVLNIIIVSSGFVLMMSLDRLVRSFLEHYRQQKMAELELQVTLDPLTGLYNRRYADTYFESLSNDPAEAECYMAIADIDDFKKVNDTYGHDAGDVTLRIISELFKSNTRKSDRVFRWGGEEFLLVIHDVSAIDAFRLMDKIRTMVSEHPIVYKEHTFRVSITAGLARLDPHNIPCTIELCDKRMYQGKRSTKNVVVV